MERRRVLAGLGTALTVGLSGCVTTRSLAQGASEERTVPVREPDDVEPFTLPEVGGALRAAGARVVVIEAVGTLAQMSYEPVDLSREESVAVVADAFARHVTSGEDTSRLGGIVVDGENDPVANYFVLSRWVDDLEEGRISREGYLEHVYETLEAQ